MQTFPAELLAAWTPLKADGIVDVARSFALVAKLRAELEASGVAADVAALAAGAFVNDQREPSFGLNGTHQRDHLRAAQALSTLEAWASAQSVAKAA